MTDGNVHCLYTYKIINILITFVFEYLCEIY